MHKQMQLSTMKTVHFVEVVVQFYIVTHKQPAKVSSLLWIMLPQDWTTLFSGLYETQGNFDRLKHSISLQT